MKSFTNYDFSAMAKLNSFWHAMTLYSCCEAFQLCHSQRVESEKKGLNQNCIFATFLYGNYRWLQKNRLHFSSFSIYTQSMRDWRAAHNAFGCRLVWHVFCVLNMPNTFAASLVFAAKPTILELELVQYAMNVCSCSGIFHFNFFSRIAVHFIFLFINFTAWMMCEICNCNKSMVGIASQITGTGSHTTNFTFRHS